MIHKTWIYVVKFYCNLCFVSNAEKFGNFCYLCCNRYGTFGMVSDIKIQSHHIIMNTIKRIVTILTAETTLECVIGVDNDNCCLLNNDVL